MESLFCDGVFDVAVVNDVVRIEFFRLRAKHADALPKDEKPALDRVPTLCLAMPLEAFGRSVSVFEKVRSELTAKGVLRWGAAVQESADADPANANLSPNIIFDDKS